MSFLSMTRARWSGLGLWIAVLALLGSPSANHQTFDGIPFSCPQEFIAVFLLLPFLASSRLRRLARHALGRVHRLGALAIGALAVAGVTIKLVLIGAGTHAGFSACYQPAVPDVPAQGCERSYENPFSRYGATRLDPIIDFGLDDWNLSFVNSLRFNYYPWAGGVISRDRMPFTTTWVGTIEVEEESRLEIRYNGEGRIIIGGIGDEVRLEPTYDRVRNVRHPLQPGRHRILVSYKFDDGFRTRQEPTGQYATLRLVLAVPTADGHDPAPLEPRSPPPGWRWLGWFVDALVWLVVAGMAVLYGLVLRREAVWSFLAAAAGLAIAATEPFGQHNIVLLLATTGVAWRLLWSRRHRVRRFLFAYVALGAFVLGWIASSELALGNVLIRDGGNDFLLYESYARSILETGSLRAGRDVFYFQPLSRYVRFLEHALLGDGDLLIVGFDLFVLNLSILFLCAAAWQRKRVPVLMVLAATASFLMLALANSENDVIELLHQGASEATTWMLFPALFAFLFAPGLERCRTPGVAALAVSLITRLNQAPAIVWMLATCFGQGRHAGLKR